MRAGTRAEDLQDQAGAIDHLGIPRLLKIALLHGREPVVDDDQADLLLFRRLLDALDHALADQCRGRQSPHRHRLREAHVEVDGARESDRLLELGVAVALVAGPMARSVRTEHCGDRGWSRRLLWRALALVVSVALDVVCQISLRLCLRRTTGR